jgi:hypothetical protein
LAKRTQVVEVEDRNPFGEELDGELLDQPERSITYIPGYSDKRQAFEAAQRDGNPVTPLDFRLQCVRAESAQGTADNRKVAEWRAKGYEVLSWDDAIAKGLDLDVSAAHKGAAGDVRIGDLVVMITDQKTAATHYARNREAISQQWEQRVYRPLTEAAEAYNVAHGRTAATGTAFEFIEEPQGKLKGKGKKIKT